MFQKTAVGAIEFQVSQVIGRLEEAVEGKSSNVSLDPQTPSNNALPSRSNQDILAQLEVSLFQCTKSYVHTLYLDNSLNFCYEKETYHIATVVRIKFPKFSNTMVSFHF